MVFSSIIRSGLGFLTVVPLTLALLGCQAEPPIADNDPALTPDPKTNVILYTGLAQEITGRLVRVEPDTLYLETGPEKKLQAIPRREVRGTVLDTPAERAALQKITNNAVIWIAVADYNTAIKDSLMRKLNRPKTPCKSPSIPVAHFQVTRKGEIQNLRLIAASDCPAYNKAVIQAIRKLQPEPLPSEYPLEVFPMNYFYPVKKPPATPSKANQPKPSRLI